MGQPAAKQGDRVVATDTHLVVVPGVTSPVALPHPFSGVIGGNLSGTVKIMGRPAATVGSSADNVPPHTPAAPASGFATPPTNQATIQLGSGTVKINGRPAARNGDPALTCNDPAPAPVGQVLAQGTVRIG